MELSDIEKSIVDRARRIQSGTIRVMFVNSEGRKVGLTADRIVELLTEALRDVE